MTPERPHPTGEPRRIRIRPMTQRDIPHVAAVQHAAFADMSIFPHVLPRVNDYPNLYPHYIALSHQLYLASPTYHCFVGADVTTDEPLCYALWTESVDCPRPEGWEKRNSIWLMFERALLRVELAYADFALNGWADFPGIASMFGQLEEHLKRWGRPHVYLKHLCVRPDCQGLGFGGLLVKHGLEAARKVGMGASLESTSEGASRLYARYGFREFGVVVLGRGKVNETRSPVMVWDGDTSRNGAVGDGDRNSETERDHGPLT